jgi:isocitrate/isopropylmalate dehydrogenase
MNEYKLLLVPGDGIGPEVMDATMRVVGWFGQKGLAYKTEEALLGGVAIDKVGRPDPDETFVKDPNGTACRLKSAPNAGCCASARIWASMPICARRCALMR